MGPKDQAVLSEWETLDADGNPSHFVITQDETGLRRLYMNRIPELEPAWVELPLGPDAADRIAALEARYEATLSILKKTFEAYLVASTLAYGTRGGKALLERGREPKAGDFVYLTIHAQPTERSFGWLREIKEAHGTQVWPRYLVEPATGGPAIWWQNVKVNVIPMGDLFGDLLGDIDSVFQPQETRTHG